VNRCDKFVYLRMIGREFRRVFHARQSSFISQVYILDKYSISVFFLDNLSSPVKLDFLHLEIFFDNKNIF